MIEIFYVIASLSLFSSALFLILSIVFLRMYRLYSDQIWMRLFLGYLMFSISQLIMILSILVQEPGISYSLYTLSPASALSASYLIWSSKRSFEKTSVYLMIPPIYLLMPSTLDFITTLFLILSQSGFRGFVRIGLLMFSASYLLRGLWILTPDPLQLIYILILSEFIRVSGALLMSLVYVRRIIR
jgi:hypothetical protein